ncbi:MAG TPA: kelch repeat-containing protein [Bryobacteraceae bacterium]|jgi:hypothetical protein|nr:kelch repeat-containing protein [Bryobacteraceae bacterium]
MKSWKLALLLGVIPALLAAASDQTSANHKPGGTWTALLNQPAFTAAHTLLLTDGTVICQELETGNWHRLTPDKHGSYINGTWSDIASMPDSYAPLYYASAVLADGRVAIAGGEFNFPSNATNMAAIYDPQKNSWSMLAPPDGWSSIADASSVVLPDKRWMIANAFSSDTAALDPKTLQWTVLSPNGKADSNNEEGWTLLPDGTVLTVDVANVPNSERYFPSSNIWESAGSTPLPLSDHSSFEIGPAVLRPDGTVFYTGVCPFDANGNCVSPAHTAIYTPPKNHYATGTWTAGPDFPDGLDIDDGPASILPDGNVLLMTSPGNSQVGAVFFEFDGKELNPAAAPPNAPDTPSYYGNMLVLPTGQVLLTTFSNDVEIYTAAGKHNPAWEPCIENAPLLVAPGKTYKIEGLQFNGVSDGAAYGDDAQSNTNYPLLRFTDFRTHDVSYWRTHDHSTMAVATGKKKVFTYFDVPDTMQPAIGWISVVANGIASDPRFVIVAP